MSDTSYAELFRHTDFRKHPEAYRIGKGEQGVLMAEPYKSEILPHWKFKTAEVAEVSARKIYDMFISYLSEDDFVGADMARKFLQMGWTRSRRYANHSSGRKYKNGVVSSQDAGSEQSEKAQSARIFYEQYLRARTNEKYVRAKKAWMEKEKSSR